MKYQYDIDSQDVNINCKGNDNDIGCNNKTQNTVKNEVIVNENYKKIKVIEECNDENKSIWDDLNQNNVEEWNPEDIVTNEEMNILPVAVTQDARISISKGSLGTTKDKIIRQGSKSIISSCCYI